MIENFRELLKSRELLFNLTRKEVKVKYKNSVLGFFWSLIYPLIMLMVFYVAFGVIFKVRGEGMNYYAFFLMCGILPWNFFSQSLTMAASSIVRDGALVKKIYFPREVLPLSQIGSNSFNFVLQVLVLVAFMIFFRIPLSYWIFAFPLVLFLEVVFIAGLSLFLSALNVYFRDVQYFTELLLIAWFWMTPIVYPFTFITQRLPIWGQKLYLMNPMAHIILLYQYILYNPRVNAQAAFQDVELISWKSVTAVAVGSLILLMLSYLYFIRQEGRFAEFI